MQIGNIRHVGRLRIMRDKSNMAPYAGANRRMPLASQNQIDIELFTAREDNFGVLVHNRASNITLSIDAPGETAICDALTRKGWKLDHILTTHKHGDHIEANLALKARFGCTIIGPEGDKALIPGIDQTVKGGDSLTLGSIDIKVIDTPGHTKACISYYLPAANAVFTADCLFSLGCGRIFDGTPDMMWASLQRLMALPRNTKIYCGHEYSAANARFALAVDADNADLQARAGQIRLLRDQGKPTLPVTLAQELATNPFLRVDDPAIRAFLGMETATDGAVFAELRQRKNNF
jgi:hydroxyacylglutathione hydrolase